MQHTLKQLESGELKGLKRIKIEEDLKEFPRDILALAESLEVLDLTNNQLDSLPDDFHRLQNLKILFISNNNFTALPKVLGECLKLEMIGFKSNQIIEVPEESLPPMTRWLILTDNKIKRLPENIGNLHRLQKLMLAGNCLKALPASLSKCTALELIRVSANQFESLPEVLMSLANLRWLAFNGNPFSQLDFKHDILKLSLDDLSLKEVLGEGASGTIYQASWRNNQHGLPDDVAVKVFKKGITSDGYAADELKSCLAVGEHENLTSVLALAEDENRQAIVMKLIPADFQNLAGPPSLTSCTRDVFPKGFSLNIDQVKLIVDQMLEVGSYFKKIEFCHGDLYAHNVLYSDASEIILGDFGAAASYAMLTEEEKVKIQQIEDRALGVFIEDLLEVCSPSDQKHEGFTSLKNLAKKLLN